MTTFTNPITNQKTVTSDHLPKMTKSDDIDKKIQALTSRCEICENVDSKIYTYVYGGSTHRLCSRHYKWFRLQSKKKNFEILSWESIIKAKKEIDNRFTEKQIRIEKFQLWLKTQGIESFNPSNSYPDGLKNLIQEALRDHNPRTEPSEKYWKNWSCLNCGLATTNFRGRGPYNKNDFCASCAAAWKKFMEAKNLKNNQLMLRNTILTLIAEPKIELDTPPSKKIKSENRMDISFLTGGNEKGLHSLP